MFLELSLPLHFSANSLLLEVELKLEIVITLPIALSYGKRLV